ncbi:8-amino-7-oxononanoate synthase [Comamonas endophytica]|uniref:8-amino-7-oxononanoate synthase n=1 Tax=Comamonas endophytica TaxID=2949090 RepID=A0ABY6GFR0_9BURK|nr:MULTISPECIES: 8-amino-7-oxononanoate synthase [unclassified Acidovorax]MCD2514268.1 8-amino-7-oxononanoate synthase [Acidovorax sp. D4N7]UYG53520.1 8-amino-7-oxononanoate synthase [Acidovorax sp. 5MLIR]
MAMKDLAPDSWLQELPRQLQALHDQHLLRTRRRVAPRQGAHITVDGETMLQFCSNDYLGLARHPALIEAARQGALEFGVGSGGSPMVSGHSTANAELETALSSYVQLPRALYFYAGFATNASVIPALVGEGDEIFSDALNHASLIDGCRLSRASIRRYPHADLAALERLLAASAGRRKLVVSDAVYSMDGDVADIPGLLALCERHDALLMLDDAHGLGVRGPQGRGSLAAVGLTGAHASPRLLYMGTLGKAAGVAGAFVAGSAPLVEWLLQRTRSYTFATAAPGLLARALLASLAAMEQSDSLRSHLQARIAQLRAGLAPLSAAMGWRLLPSETPIQALVIGDNATALQLMAALSRQAIWVPAIRPPTVPAGTARLRIALSACHTSEDIERLLQALKAAAGVLPGWHEEA